MNERVSHDGDSLGPTRPDVKVPQPGFEPEHNSRVNEAVLDRIAELEAALGYLVKAGNAATRATEYLCRQRETAEAVNLNGLLHDAVLRARSVLSPPALQAREKARPNENDRNPTRISLPADLMSDLLEYFDNRTDLTHTDRINDAGHLASRIREFSREVHE